MKQPITRVKFDCNEARFINNSIFLLGGLWSNRLIREVKMAINLILRLDTKYFFNFHILEYNYTLHFIYCLTTYVCIYRSSAPDPYYNSHRPLGAWILKTRDFWRRICIFCIWIFRHVSVLWFIIFWYNLNLWCFGYHVLHTIWLF